jgi:Zn-dependent protease
MSAYDLTKRRPGTTRPSPLFLGVVAVALAGGVIAWTQNRAGSRLGDFGVFLLVLGGWVVSVCLHEFAHAYAAYRAGDRSVEARGYLTLNPFKYAHPVLSILLPLFFIVSGGIGLPGGAVYLHQHAFRSRASRSVAAAVGPATNLVFALVLLFLAKPHLGDVVGYLTIGGPADNHARFWAALAILGFLQATAAVLNLLPVPGLDGYAIIEPFLDPETVRIGNKVKPWGMLGVIVLLLYITPLNNAFFRLVDWLCARTGADQLLWAAGREFFRFWAKSPL